VGGRGGGLEMSGWGGERRKEKRGGEGREKREGGVVVTGQALESRKGKKYYEVAEWKRVKCAQKA